MSSATGAAGNSVATTSTSQPPTSSPGTSLSSPPSSSLSASTNDSSTNSPETSTSTQPTSTANAPTTSSTAAASETAATTPQSSPADQGSSAVVHTTVASQASASSAATTTAAVTTTSSFTSQVETTLVSTDPAGSIVYVTTTTPEVFTTSVTSSTVTTSSNSHTGVIVGAVVGGVAGIIILVLLLFCIRKRVRKDEFDGNFDPDHVVERADRGGGTLPRVDLAEDVTPFPQPYTDQGSSGMRQFGDSPYIGLPSSLAASGQTSPDLYSSVDPQSRQFVQHGLSPAGAYVSPVSKYGSSGEWHSPRPGASSPPSTSSHNSSSRGTKEREALGRGGQGQTLGLATQLETAEGSADIVVHQDAGRAPIEDHSSPKEIPPAYESIPQD